MVTVSFRTLQEESESWQAQKKGGQTSGSQIPRPGEGAFRRLLGFALTRQARRSCGRQDVFARPVPLCLRVACSEVGTPQLVAGERAFLSARRGAAPSVGCR